eukprot:502179-Amphidinium_carterae.1
MVAHAFKAAGCRSFPGYFAVANNAKRRHVAAGFAWCRTNCCRLTGQTLVVWGRAPTQRHFQLGAC